MQRRGTPAGVFLEVLVVAVNRVIVRLFDLDQRSVQANDRPLLQEITVRVTGTMLPLFFIDDPKLSEIDGSRNRWPAYFARCNAW